MPSITCVDKLLKLFWSLNLMVCHFQEPNRVKFIKELSEVNPEIKEKSKPTEHALSLIELDMLCSILYSADLWLITAHSSSNISL